MIRVIHLKTDESGRWFDNCLLIQSIIARKNLFTHETFTYSKSIIETLENDVKYVHDELANDKNTRRRH